MSAFRGYKKFIGEIRNFTYCEHKDSDSANKFEFIKFIGECGEEEGKFIDLKKGCKG